MPSTTPPPPEPEVVGRRRAVAVAGHRGDEAAALVALGDPAPAVRATALAALARMGAVSEAHWRSGLADADPVVRRRACEICVRFAPASLPPLTQALLDPDPSVVEAACFALGEIGGAAADAVAAIVTGPVRHRDPIVREAAVAALGAIGDQRGLAAILDATHDKPAIRRRAVLALAPFEGPEVDRALQQALEDRDWQVRQAAEDLGATAP